MTKISLIIPVYNTSKYLKKCLDSVISQSVKEIEIIIINDGSTDDSEEIINTYKDKRIKYISKQNEGIGKTRNLGIEKATGKYLAFVDSDDYLDKYFCEKMLKKATQDDCDIVICNYYEDDNDHLKKINFIEFLDTSLQKKPNLINYINLGPCNKIYRTKLIRDNNIKFEEVLKYEDVPFVIKALINAEKIGKVSDYLTYYVIHEKSETTVRDKRIFDILKIVDIVTKEMTNVNYSQEHITNLVVMILTDYTIQQRYIKDRHVRNDFINRAFTYLNQLDSNWRNCEYLKKFNYLKRLVKTNKILTKIYCDIYIILGSVGKLSD